MVKWWCVCVAQLAQLIVNAGGVAAMVDYVSDTCGNVRLPALMMLGYVAAHSENLAMAVIVSKVSAFAFSWILSFMKCAGRRGYGKIYRVGGQK